MSVKKWKSFRSSETGESSEQLLDEWSLHRFALENRVDDLRNALGLENIKSCINRGDHLDNTPLHLATMHGNRKIVKLLLINGALVDCENEKHETPLTEAITYGNQEIVSMLLKALQKQTLESMPEKQDQLRERLSSIADFTVNLSWKNVDFEDPGKYTFKSEECILFKKGNQIRLDIRIEYMDSSDLNLYASLIFDGNEMDASKSLCFINHVKEEFQWIYHKSVKATEHDLKVLMRSKVNIKYFLSKKMRVIRSDYQPTRINISTMPSQLPDTTWKKYRSSKHGNISREQKFSLVFSLSSCSVALQSIERLQLKKNQLKTVLSCVSPLSRFGELCDLLDLDFPDIFPYSIDFRQSYGRSYQIKFTNFRPKPDLSQSLFKVPENYKENIFSFPGLGF